MELMCEVHRKMETIELLPGGFIRFECGMARQETADDLRQLSKKYGGER